MDYSPLVSLNKALFGPYFLGGGGVAVGGSTLDSHDWQEGWVYPQYQVFRPDPDRKKIPQRQSRMKPWAQLPGET